MLKTINEDDRIILTLDAGGTNFSFAAYQFGKRVIGPFNYEAKAEDLDECLDQIVNCFKEIINACSSPIAAISFSFPGPADYINGVVGVLSNLKAFKSPVALGPYLSEIFNVPVFMNNDGDLFTLGEGIFGVLPQINDELEKYGQSRKYNNLIGLTLGTGVGAGLFTNNNKYSGDNSHAMEIWTTRSSLNTDVFLEEDVSKAAIIKAYGDKDKTPLDIYEIAKGIQKGDQELALKVYVDYGSALGDAIANLITLLDGIVVIGGGISKAHELYMPTVMKVVNGKINFKNGESKNRIVQSTYDLNKSEERKLFLKDDSIKVPIPKTDQFARYYSNKKVGLINSGLGTNHSVSLGAYAFAITKLNEK